MVSSNVLKKLTDGFEVFRKENYEVNPERMARLIKDGQSPEALVIACSDSRSCPESVFDTEPGDIFVSRHIAALVPPYDASDNDNTIAASIEFAVMTLEVKHIIVVGHTHCGGIQALAQNVQSGAVGSLIQRAREIREIVQQKSDKPLDNADTIKKMELESIIWSFNNLKNYPCVKKAIKNDKLSIHGWQFDMEYGTMLEYAP